MIENQESATANLCAYARAYHSNFAETKIFDDYLAYEFMGEEEYKNIEELIQQEFRYKQNNPRNNFEEKEVYSLLRKYSAIPLSRIAYAEGKLKEFAEEHGVCQYVICGSGMDTFSFRNENPNIIVFELDHPDTQRYKLQRIEELQWDMPVNVHFVPIDFSKDDMKRVLMESGYNPAIPTFFSILGVTYYLRLSVFDNTLENITKLSEVGSKIVFDYPNGSDFNERRSDSVKQLTQLTADLGEPMNEGYSLKDLEEVLKKHGFILEEHMVREDIQKRFFEKRSDHQQAFEGVNFILGVRRY